MCPHNRKEQPKLNTTITTTPPCNEWMRAKDAANRIGIKTARFFELLRESNGAIKSCLLKSPGAQRGARLINMASLFAYLDNLAAEEDR
jgi:hypothetical protein